MLSRRFATPHLLRPLTLGLTQPRKYLEYQRLRETSPAIRSFLEHRCIYVHIPKCAGNAIEKSLFGEVFGGHLTAWHYRMIFRPNEFRTFFKFAIVRNPWDRLVSAFHFLKKGGLNPYDRWWAEKHLGQFPDFDSFVKHGLNLKNINSFVHFQPQASFVFLNGELQVDYVGRLENLEHDFGHICQRLGMEKELLVVNALSNKQRDYRSHYTDVTRDIVADVYKEDIDRFGYAFDSMSSRKSAAENRPEIDDEPSWKRIFAG
jgi:hypothetical protein